MIYNIISYYNMVLCIPPLTMSPVDCPPSKNDGNDNDNDNNSSSLCCDHKCGGTNCSAQIHCIEVSGDTVKKVTLMVKDKVHHGQCLLCYPLQAHIQSQSWQSWWRMEHELDLEHSLNLEY